MNSGVTQELRQVDVICTDTSTAENTDALFFLFIHYDQRPQMLYRMNSHTPRKEKCEKHPKSDEVPKRSGYNRPQVWRYKPFSGTALSRKGSNGWMQANVFAR